MKKFILFAIATLCSLTSSAEKLVLDSTIVKTPTGDVWTKQYYTYNEQGLEVSNIYKSFPYSYYEVAERFTQKTYDEQSHLVKVETYDIKDGVKTLTSFSEYSNFNEQGLPQVEIYSTMDSEGNAYPSVKYEISTYDILGNKVQYITYYINNGEWASDGETIGEVDSEGRLSHIRAEQDMGTIHIVSDYNWYYDDHNSLIKYTTQKSMNNVPVTPYEEVYEYVYNEETGLPAQMKQTNSEEGDVSTSYFYFGELKSAGITTVQDAVPSVRKYLQGNKIIINKDGKKYSVLGQEL